jgi:aminoglycoside 3'-phosphotransferase II
MESSSATLRLPRRVRAAAQAAVGGSRLSSEFAWMSWAGTVWRLGGESRAVYVKRAAHLVDERDRLAWLAGRWPVPEVIGFYRAAGDDWLLTREVPGVPLSDASVGLPPARVASLLGEILRGIHRTDATGCPFGTSKPGHVLIHGDYCLPNVLVTGGAGRAQGAPPKLSALIDVGRAGLGDPRDDLAAGVWALRYNFGAGFAREFLDAYGAPPMTDAEIERLRRRYGR